MKQITPPIEPQSKPKPITQSGRIIRMLTDAGSRGVENHKFPEAGILQYGARINGLRKDGHSIYCEQKKIDGRATGTFIYYLGDAPDPEGSK